MNASRILIDVAKELNDYEPGYEFTRWTKDTLLEYLRQAIEQLAAVKGSMFTTSTEITLQPGSYQMLPEGCVKLHRIIGTVASDGSVVPAHKAQYEMANALGASVCVVQDGEPSITSYAFDPDDSRAFRVSPPVDPAYPITVRAVCEQEPTTPKTIDDEIKFPGGEQSKYYNALKDWMLYRAFMTDTESATDLSRADRHYRNFYQSLNVKMQSDRQEARQ